MAEPNFDDILGDAAPAAAPVVAQSPQPAASASSGTIDPTVIQTLIGEAGLDPDGLKAVATVIRNRAAASGESLSQIVADRGQFESGAPTGTPELAAWSKSQKYQPGSAAYQQALAATQGILTGQEAPIGPYTAYYSPKAQAQFGRSAPTWANGPGASIGGNSFYTVPYAGAATGEPDFDQLVNGPAPAHGGPTDAQMGAVQALADAKAAAQAGQPVTPGSAAALAAQQLQAASGSGHPQWPIFDPINHVGRNQDGSIAFVGDPPTASVGPDGSLQVNIAASSHPDAIAAYLKNHPLDPANHPQPVQTADQDTLDPPDALDKLSVGMARGLSNVANSVTGADVALRSNPIGNTILSGLEPNLTPLSAERAQLGQAVMNRNANDVAFDGSTAYGLGKFGGELAGTLPLMAATDGVAGGALDAGLAGTKFAPAADFLAGQTPGRLIGARGASLAAHGALQGGEAAALTSAGSSAPLSQQVGQGMAGGAIAGLAPSVAGAAMNRFGQTASLPQGVAALADRAINKYKIPISGPQILGAAGDRNAAIRWSNMFSEPGSGVGSNFAGQKAAWTSRIGDTFGGDANGQPIESFSPEVLNGARKRIGGVMNNFASSADVTDLDDLHQGLSGIESEIKQTPLGDNGQSALQAQVDHIRSVIANGHLTGSDYQTLTRQNGPLDLAQGSRDGAVSHFADRIEGLLGDTVQQGVDPAELDAFTGARAQYKNVMTVARAAKNADVEGQLTPNALNTAVNQSFKSRGLFGAGNSAGDLGELANIGRFFMREPANSGTTPRFMDVVKRNAIPLGLEGGAGLMMLHDPQTAIKLGAAGVAAGALKYGGNLMYGLQNGAASGARLLAPASNKFMANSPVAQSIIDSANDNYVPAAVLGANQFFQQQTPQPSLAGPGR